MFSYTVLHKEITRSTMEDARAAVRTGSGHGTVCTASSQEEGRGRVAGRMWEDDGKGSLLFTLVLQRDSLSTKYPLTQLVALALCKRLEKAFGLVPGIKWPNDVLVGRAKIAGILVETEGDYYLAGVGVNVLQSAFSTNIRRPATSIAQSISQSESGAIPPSSPQDELPGLLYELGCLIDESPDIQELEDRLIGVGRPVTVSLGDPSRKESLKGTVSGLQYDGALLINLNGGEIRPVYSGEIQEIQLD
jgi:BirA family biotin operon repressor/biotin-[acetyl-CoA-carboxylase] ligase